MKLYVPSRRLGSRMVKRTKKDGHGGVRPGAGAPGKERLNTRRDRLGRLLSKKVVSTRYPEDVYAVLDAMNSEERHRLIREAVEAHLIALGKLQPQEPDADEV
ncbi:hypothetical protein H6G00_00980 [Leptolyngbya sp. FACHB-541]|uniref:hypothetical protein n=1 Tax=Leptolyngbya sp. FACHB-541 TaxID=2692810 RepID=UPI0016884AA3|nr:hypothetical protein [Leptolyngbya sp. FACHB-541]MBD1995202.1 hypothetical protein [Leptolyngbya sp. FACHB-541]